MHNRQFGKRFFFSKENSAPLCNLKKKRDKTRALPTMGAPYTVESLIQGSTIHTDFLS